MKKWECTICGYIHEGDAPPDECPLCGADSSLFVEVMEENSEQVSEAASDGTNDEKPEVAGNKVVEQINDLIMRFHLHPISVHTPNGIIPLAALLILGAALFNAVSFDTAAFYSLIFVLLNMPFVLYTGYVTWQKRYQGKMTSLFRIKIVTSITATILVVVLVFWRALRPEVLTSWSSAKILYVLLAFVLLATVGIAGHMGGKLVFGGRK
jgi:uncharacterized membrane protein